MANDSAVAVGSGGAAGAVGERNSAATRDAIREAARRLFPQHGFSATSIRDIARAAGCDAALVVRYFRSKENLFLETMSVDEPFRALFEGPLDSLGPTTVRRLLGRDETARSYYTALMRAAERPEVRAYLARMTLEHLVEPLVARLSGEDRELRAHLFAALLDGLLQRLWIVEDPVLLAAPVSTLVQVYGAALQQLVDGDELSGS